MARFVTTSEIACAPGEVFAFIVDLSRWPLFTGWGPLPGIVEASLPEGGRMALGARVRVRNTDGSVHHEVVTEFAPGARYAIRMELSPPASWLMRRIDEEVLLAESAPGRTRMTRTFVLTPRAWWTAPLVALIAHGLLARAVAAHDARVAAALSP